MKTPSPESPIRRSPSHQVQSRWQRVWASWFGGHAEHSPATSVARPRGRSREDQITIEVLRFRVAHPDAVRENGTGAVYSPAFRNFVMHRYQEEQGHLTRHKFSRAAEIPVATLRMWLVEPVPQTQPISATRPAPAFASAAERPVALAERAPGFSWQALTHWVREHLRYEKFDFYYLTDYGRKELRRVYQKNFSRGLAIAAVLHIFGILIYWSTLDEGETPKTVTIFKYVEIKPIAVPEGRRPKRRRAGGGSSAEAAAPGTPAPGQPGPINALENFVPMVAIEQLKEVAQLGRPSLPGLAPPQRITSSLHASALPELDIGSIGFYDRNAPDYQDPSGIGLPSATAPGAAKDLGADLRATKVGYGGGGGVIGGTGVGGSGGGGEYGYGSGGSGGGSGSSKGSGPGLKSAIARPGQEAPQQKVEVKEKNLETVDLNQVFLELIEWLKSNQSEISPVLKHYLRYRPGDLTARVEVPTTPVNYELFILCNEYSQDIGLLLVEEGTGHAIMLRDTGFRKKSFYLSKGLASRDEDHIVSSLTMLENSPTRAETSQFYNIFLSWWENNKNK